MKKLKSWVNGQFMLSEDATVPLLTHALHYGTGVFEGIRVYRTSHGPASFRLTEHLDRLWSGIEIMDMKLNYSKVELSQIIQELVVINDLEECYVRPLAVYGTGSMSLDVANGVVHLSVSCWPWPPLLGHDAVQNGITMKTVSLVRNLPRSLPPTVKITGSYANSVMAKSDAHRLGYDEALLLDYTGCVCEGSGENIFFVKDDKLFVVESDSMLPGITRDTVIRLARDASHRVIPTHTTVDKLYAADEVFLTGTGCEVTPVRMVDHATIGTGRPGPVTRELQDLYQRTVHGEIVQYQKWLAAVQTKSTLIK